MHWAATTISSVPLHPLVVHGAVVFAPLGACLATGFALLPRHRWVIKWPLVCTLAVAGLSALLATMTGESLLEARPALAEMELVQSHAALGVRARNVIVAMVLVGLLASWRLPSVSPLRPLDPPRSDGPVERTLVVGTVLLSVAVLILTFQAGHSGAQAVWG